MAWYLASFITHRASEDSFLCRNCWIILTAPNSDAAYDKSLDLAQSIVQKMSMEHSSQWMLDGPSQLLRMDPPAPYREISWAESEMDSATLAGHVSTKDHLRAFQPDAGEHSGSGWYVCELVVVEVHDVGSHGETLLVWTNTHLIEAPDRECAYKSALDLGRLHEDGHHRCDGDLAHWECRGLRDLLPAIEPPRDGALLWFEEFSTSPEELRTRVPPRSELGVFEWEATQRKET